MKKAIKIIVAFLISLFEKKKMMVMAIIFYSSPFAVNKVSLELTMMHGFKKNV